MRATKFITDIAEKVLEPAAKSIEVATERIAKGGVALESNRGVMTSVKNTMRQVRAGAGRGMHEAKNMLNSRADSIAELRAANPEKFDGLGSGIASWAIGGKGKHNFAQRAVSLMYDGETGALSKGRIAGVGVGVYALTPSSNDKRR